MSVFVTAAAASDRAQRLLQNQYAQERLNDALENLQMAYRRGSKRRVNPVEDKKLRGHVHQATIAARDAAQALQSGRNGPPKRRGRRALIVVGVGGVAAAVALAADEELRIRVLGERVASVIGGDDIVSATSGSTAPDM